MFEEVNSILSTLFDAGVLLFGVFALGVGFSRLRRHGRRHRRSLRETGSIDDSGLVAVEASIRGPLDDGLRSPFRREAGVLTKWKIEEFVGHELGSGHHWWNWGEGYESVPFTVDDGTGPVRVETSGGRAEVDVAGFDDEPVLEVAASESPPRHVRAFADEHERWDRQSETALPTRGDEQGDRRYFERTLGRGDTVYVVGHAATVADDDPSTPVATITPPDDGDGRLYLSDRPRAGALKHRRRQISFYFLFGGGLVWYGLSQFLARIDFVLSG